MRVRVDDGKGKSKGRTVSGKSNRIGAIRLGYI
jgi:hypothetical protein